MKILRNRYVRIIALALVALAFLLMPVLLFAQTNDLALTNAVIPVPPAGTNAAVTLPPGFEKAIHVLPAKAQAWIKQALVWVGAFSGVFAFVGGILGRFLRNKLNESAKHADEGQDEKLREWFSNPLYQILAYLLRTVAISLPTVSELERAVRLQREAIHDELISKGYPTIPSPEHQ